MSIQPLGAAGQGVSAVSAATPMTMTSPAPSPALNGTLSGIAQQLGMGVGTVQSALKQGLSITELASQRGVSRDALLSQVQDQIQQTRQAKGQPAADQPSSWARPYCGPVSSTCSGPWSVPSSWR